MFDIGVFDIGSFDLAAADSCAPDSSAELRGGRWERSVSVFPGVSARRLPWRDFFPTYSSPQMTVTARVPRGRV
ncbi:hypothetical protein C5E44_12695 [Nocardia nova]|nr:hypothetical protein C5E44_12695 [Nocardia nova]